MIRNITKLLFFGVKNEIHEFFHRAQCKGLIEFLPESGSTPVVLPDELANLAMALQVLRREGSPRHRTYGAELDPQELASQILELEKEKEEATDALRHLRLDLMKARPFGAFSMTELESVSQEIHRRFQFFYAKHERDKRDGEGLIFIASDHDLDFYLAVTAKGFPHQTGLIEIPMTASASELAVEIKEQEKRGASCHAQLMALTPYLTYLEEAFLIKLSQHQLATSKGDIAAHLDGKLFSVEAYIATDNLPQLTALLSGLKISYEVIAPLEEEKLPTCIENRAVNHMGQDLVLLYDTPATDDRDPSGWVLWAFALFFGIIVGDAGYGMLYLVLALFLKRRWRNAQPATQRMCTLFTLLAASCILWGVMTASYFGIEIDPDNPIERYSPMGLLVVKKAAYHLGLQDGVYQDWVIKYPDLTRVTTAREFLLKGTRHSPNGGTIYEIYDEFRDNILFECALIIGSIHLILSLIRYALRTFSSFGWILFIIGGYLYFPVLVNATTFLNYLDIFSKPIAGAIGFQLVCGGIGLALLLAVVQARWQGFKEIMTLVQVFGDVLSYLRLYALGLAGIMVAETFNDMGRNNGILLGPLIVLLGHSINMLLGVMGGVIHGLRLNFLEWYHYSFTGGGRRFNPLRILKLGE